MVKTMKIDNTYDNDKCIDFEIIPNKINWMKEENGNNVLIQYINGGEGYRMIAQFSENVSFTDARYNNHALVLRDKEGESHYYSKDKMGNYKSAAQLIHENKLAPKLYISSYSR